MWPDATAAIETVTTKTKPQKGVTITLHRKSSQELAIGSRVHYSKPVVVEEEDGSPADTIVPPAPERGHHLHLVSKMVLLHTIHRWKVLC